MSRRYIVAGFVAVLVGVIGTVFLTSYDGRSKTERVSDCLVAAGYNIQVVHDDGKQPIGGDEGLLGPLGDYQAQPPSDTVSVGAPGHGYLHAIATITVQGGRAQASILDPKRAQTIKSCAE